MPPHHGDAAPTPLRYGQLLRSTFTLFARGRLLRLRALFGLLIFAAFSALWSSVALPLGEAPYSLSLSAIGALGLIGVVGAVCALGAAFGCLGLAPRAHTRRGVPDSGAPELLGEAAEPLHAGCPVSGPCGIRCP